LPAPSNPSEAASCASTRDTRSHKTRTVSSCIFFWNLLSLKSGWPGAASDCARPTSIFRAYALREHVRRAWPPRTRLLALNGYVEGIPLPIDQQEGKIGWLNRVSQSLKHGEVVNRLSIEFEYDVTRLET